MENIKIDLHFHSTASDGRYTPEELVSKAVFESVKLLSLTDHDNVSNNDIMAGLCEEQDIYFIPGIELSTRYNGESIHILAYFKNFSYKNEEFLSTLNKFRENRETRAKEIVSRLKEFYNIEISYDELLLISDGSIGRPHVAQKIKEKYGYDFDYIFKNFIGDDSKAYIPSSKLSIEEGINLLNKTDCIKVLAHPGEYKNSISAILDKGNFDGIEVFYPSHSTEEISYYLKLAKERNLLVTCGSDFHGIINDSLHGELGSTYYVLDKLIPFFKEFEIVF